MKRENTQEHTNRLDVEMPFRGLARSRSSALDLIKRGKVSVNGKIILKPSVEIKNSDVITVSDGEKFVSRAGEKLAEALSVFHISPTGQTVLDIGSSTGGFTDCLLQNGASKVIAVDVGTNQLVPELRNDSRIELYEGTNIKTFTSSSLVDLVVVDVSFISLTHVLSKAFQSLKLHGTCIALVKPQFEVGMEIAKKYEGVITNETLQKDVMKKIKLEAKKVGFKVVANAPSPILGEKGNKEFLLHLQK